MADLGYVRALAKQIPDAATRRAFEQAFTHVLENLRLGVPEHQTRAENTQQYWLQSTTATSTGEFDIAHGLNTTPKYALLALELDRVGSKAGPLTVSRAADSRRLYLKADAGSTATPILLLIE